MQHFKEREKDYETARQEFRFNMAKHSTHILKSSSIVYVLMTVVGLLLIQFRGDAVVQYFHFDGVQVPVTNLVFATILLTLLGFTTGYLFEAFFPSYQRMRNLFLVTLGPCSVCTAFSLGVLSGIGEELLFRGGLQPYLGLLATSMLFGLVHLGPGGKVNTWSLAAGIVGLLFGYVFQQTGNLLPGIIAHSTINFVSITMLHKEYIKQFSPKPEDFSNHANVEKL